MGKTPEKLPDWAIEQLERQRQFKAVLEKRLETDRRLAEEAAKRAEKA